MPMSRGFLWLIGAIYVICGVAYLVAPVQLIAFAELELLTPVSFIEINGFYGGQMVGLGVFVLLGARRPGFVGPALLLIALNLGGTAGGRVVGIVTQGSLPSAILGILVVEVATTAAALFFYLRERKQVLEGT